MDNACKPDLRAIISFTLRNHPKDCIFTENAEEKIFERCKGYINQDDLIDKLEQAFFEAEVYCPHEGIDKR